MDMLHRVTQHLDEDESAVAASTRLLIQHGLDFLLHGNNIEGISLLVQAHARLTSERTQIATLLETAIEACARYNQAREALLNASRDYAKAEAEQQA